MDITLKPGRIYLAEAGGYQKIGHVRGNGSVIARVASLSLPFPARVIHSFPSNHAHRMELWLHGKFQAQRLHREWFQLDQADIDWLCSLTELDYTPEIDEQVVSGVAKDDDRLTVPGIAKLAGVSQETVHNWIDAEKLKAEEEYQGFRRRRFVQRAEWERFRETLPPIDPTV